MNTSGTTFGLGAANEFYMNWKMNTASDKDGEVWYLLSSVTNPLSTIDTATGTNLIQGTDGENTTLGSVTLNMGSNYTHSTEAVTNSFTYTVEESTTVRVRLRINERTVNNSGEYFNMVTRWTIYPTGQFFRYDSLYNFSGDPQDVYIGVYFNDNTNSTLYSDNTDLRFAVAYSGGYPDMTSCWLAMSNTGGYQSPPFSEDFLASASDGTRVGFDYTQSNTAPALWGNAYDPLETSFYIDISHTALNSNAMDSISNGVQFIGLSGGNALLMNTGTLLSGGSATAGDLNADGFNEMEGAYMVQATDNTVDFDLPAIGDTCRYYPAFNISNYLSATKPNYVFAYDDADTVALIEGYQYNGYLNQVDHRLVIQIDSIFCSTTGLYFSADQTLAVKMSNFEARAGNGCDTLIWRTESEQENLGYRLLRRVKPTFYDSALAAYAQIDTTDQDDVEIVGVPRLFKRGSLKAKDTTWVAVNKKLIAGAEKGISYGPRDYQFIDYEVYNEVLYEYRLVAVDYHANKEEFGPVTVMPKYLFPTKFMLGLNYPNPFRYMTTIRFALPTESKVSLNIYTLKGQLVCRLITPDKKMPAMYHHILWDGKNDHGTRVAAGPYIYRMTTTKYRKAKVMLMLK